MQTNLGPRVSLSLEPYGAALLRYPAAWVPRETPAARPARCPIWPTTLLPEVKPAMAQGEFVRTEVTPDAAHSQPERPAWPAASKLTKGQVDTFMFVRFLLPRTLEPGGRRVPGDRCLGSGRPATPDSAPGHRAGKGRRRFHRQHRRLAGSPGHHRLFVPVEPAPAARAGPRTRTASLDLKQVSEVRIGWGGYLRNRGRAGAIQRRSAASGVDCRNWH